MSLYTSRHGQESINAELLECINELRFKSNGIIDIAVVSLEGLPIVSLVLENIEETRFAAMTAAMLSLGDRVSSELNKGLLKKIFVEGENGFIISMQAGDNAVLTVSATADTKLGLLFLDMGRAVTKIASILRMY
ncbi:MAG: roadblock/LC7 domain-containing protein [Candidatus Heimdallarchaeaceae archaeon]